MSITMKRLFSSSLIVWLPVTLYGIYFLCNLHKHINFGIDLVGGTYITLEVQTDKLLENELTERVNGIIKALEERNQPAVVSQHYSKHGYQVVFADPAAAQFAEALPENRQKGLVITREGTTLTFSLTEPEQKKMIEEAVEGNINVLRARVDKFGVGEIPIAAQGEKNIVIELPNVKDLQRAKSIIGTSALLEIKPVLDDAYSEEELLERYHNVLPENTEIVPDRERRGQKKFYLVPRYADLTGRLLKTARPDTGGEFGFEPVVAFELKPEGGEKFYELTRNPQQALAMIVDGVAVTVATAKTPLHTHGYISGNFSQEETIELAALLRSGAFVAPVTFEEDRTIGPSLGSESIHAGLLSCLIGLALLFLFSIIMYKVAGLFAFVVLLYNLLLILFALSWLGATLTLPGIAGMVLTIGMAIDSSILIYERIREELSQGAALRAAVTAGFSGAMVTILDANITHFLVAVVLYKLGAGAIQGFAVTMIVGIIATLLTGLVLLRAIFNFLIDIVGVKTIKI